MSYLAGTYEVVVIGGGHAGIEAALAAARLGHRTLMITTNLDSVGNMPCNPSIGGTAKGQLVREIDALGGEMGRAADACGIQFRMLNRGKGPAVHSPRAQADRAAYKQYMKEVLEHCENLSIRQGEAAEILTQEGKVSGVLCVGGALYETRALVVCTGTFLNSRIFIGEQNIFSGPDGLAAATHLTESMEKLGLRTRRFKTGTPARVDARSIDFSALEVQRGDEPPRPFSFDFQGQLYNDSLCYLTYTNSHTHEIIRKSLDRSPLYGGEIQGVGPRYCPSIEDKIVRFSTKERHQVFIEPCGKILVRCICRGFPPLFRRMYSWLSCVLCLGWRKWRSCGRAMPLNMTAWTPPSLPPVWGCGVCPDCMPPDRSAALPVMRKRQARVLLPVSMPPDSWREGKRWCWPGSTATSAL